MYHKSKHKRKRIQRRTFFETQILPYILTSMVLFICFLVTIMLGVRFSSVGSMILWILGIGFLLGSLLLEYFKTNITKIIKKAFGWIDFLEKKLKKK